MACATWGAATMLHVLPTEADFTLHDLGMRLMLRQRLGLQTIGDNQWCERCRAMLDRDGHHSNACLGNPGIRHNRLRDLLQRLLASGGFTVHTKQEEPQLRHRPDLRVEAGLAPVLTYLEVHVTHPTAPTANHTANALGTDAATTNAWNDKLRRDYAPLPERPNFRLLPAVATTYGGWHTETKRFLQECASRVATAAGRQPNSAAIKQALLQRWVCSLSVALHRENAAMLQRCTAMAGRDISDRPWSEGAPPLWDLPSAPCLVCNALES